MKKFGYITATLILLFTGLDCRISFAQNPGTLEFDHLTTNNGLSQNSGHVILQDSQGFMWIGTNSGLNRYNGYEFTVFNHDPEDSTKISGDNLSTIYEDRRGNLWVGATGAGLNLFDRDTQTFRHYKITYNDDGQVSSGAISNNSISSILELDNGQFWLGTDEGLNLFDRDTETFVHFYADSTDPDSLGSSRITALFQDSRGTFWIGTGRGLHIFNTEDQTFTRFPESGADPSGLREKTINKIYEDRHGILWFATGEGLYSYDRKSQSFSVYLPDHRDPTSISGSSIFSILEDHRGMLWIGTENNGLNAFDRESKTFHHYQSNLDDPNSLSNDAIYSLHESDNNILWIGTYSGGINYLDRKKPDFEHYKHNSGSDYTLSSNSVTSFLEDSHGNFWVGTDGGGLNRFDRESGDFYTLRHDPDDKNSLSSDVVLALLEDRRGHIWIGYYNGGISRFEPQEGRFTHYRSGPDKETNLCHEDIFALYEDSEGIIWAGTNGGGVCGLNPETGKFTHYQAQEGVIRDIMEDSMGDFWLATYGGGLKKLDREEGGVWNFYEGGNGLRSNIILTIHEDQNNNFWLGTKEGGIHLFDRDSLAFTSYDVDYGLSNNEVKGILEDNNGNLWLSTNDGLSRFNPRTLEFLNFSVKDGLQGEEFNTLAYYKDRSGYMYFGGLNGFNRFHPDSIRRNSFEYPLVFTDFKIFNRSVTAGKDSPIERHISQTNHITLSHAASVLTFEYAALNYNSVKEIRYAYKLEGFETEWNQVGDRRSATYTNLDPGEYTLKVRTANSSGKWNEAGLILPITITPPFWQTTWFYLIAALMLSGLIYGGYRFRVRQITRQNRLLARKIADRTSKLSQKNNELEKALDDLQKTRDQLVDNAHKAGMADLATGVLHNVGNILNSVNTSASLIADTVTDSKVEELVQANSVLREHIGELEEFIVKNPKGKKLMQYYLKLEEPLKNEQNKIIQQAERLTNKIELINEVIAAQQSYAGARMEADELELSAMIDDALALQAGSIDRHGLTVTKELEPIDPIEAQRSKLIHLLVNLIKNAKEAMAKNPPKQKVLTIKTWQDQNNIYLSISDNGKGIRKENLDKVFKHGFTTKKNGHGFGLHSCANYMTEMGGNIRVESEGQGKGTTFICLFPKKDRNKLGSTESEQKME